MWLVRLCGSSCPENSSDMNIGSTAIGSSSLNRYHCFGKASLRLTEQLEFESYLSMNTQRPRRLTCSTDWQTADNYGLDTWVDTCNRIPKRHFGYKCHHSCMDSADTCHKDSWASPLPDLHNSFLRIQCDTSTCNRLDHLSRKLHCFYTDQARRDSLLDFTDYN